MPALMRSEDGNERGVQRQGSGKTWRFEGLVTGVKRGIGMARKAGSGREGDWLDQHSLSSKRQGLRDLTAREAMGRVGGIIGGGVRRFGTGGRDVQCCHGLVGGHGKGQEGQHCEQQALSEFHNRPPPHTDPNENRYSTISAII